MFVQLTIMTHFSLLAFYYSVYHVVTNRNGTKDICLQIGI
jgi:hypothetical protein